MTVCNCARVLLVSNYLLLLSFSPTDFLVQMECSVNIKSMKCLIYKTVNQSLCVIKKTNFIPFLKLALNHKKNYL